MNEIYIKVIQQQMAAASEATRRQNKKRKHNDDPDKPKYEYDSDEDTEGGTWEHKKRATEMQKTAGMYSCMCTVGCPRYIYCKNNTLNERFVFSHPEGYQWISLK